MEFPLTNSLACERLSAMVLRALQRAGRAFSPGSGIGLTALMGSWPRSAGWQVLQNDAYALDVSAGTPLHRCFCYQAQAFAHQVQPFLLAMEVTTAVEFEEVFHGIHQEMRAEAFC